jgi:polar amino acid transport system substrate-binding protein
MNRPWSALAAAIGIALAAAIGIALPAHADPPVLPDLKPIMDRGKLVVALRSEDVAPVVSTDAAGTLGGFDVDLARALARQLGVEVEFRRQARSSDQVVDAVARKEADIGMGLLSVRADWAMQVLFTRPYARQAIAAFVNRKRAVALGGRCPTLTDIRALARQQGQIGIQRQSATAGWFREGVPDAQAQEFDRLDDLFEAALAGKVLLTVQGEIGARVLLHARPAASIQLQLCVLDTRPDPIAIAVRPDAPGLARWIDAFLLERDVFYEAGVIARYQGPWLFRKGDPLRR